MTSADIAVIASSVSAVAAIVAPIVTAVVTLKAQERMKKSELYSPRVYDALAKMADTYAHLFRGSMLPSDDALGVDILTQLRDNYQEFLSASYEVMSLIPGDGIRKQITDLLNAVQASYYQPGQQEDKMYCQLMGDINDYLLTLKVKKPIRHAKDKG